MTMHSATRPLQSIPARWRRASRRRPRRCSATGSPTDIGCSNWKPTPPSRPNTCCCAIISASRSMRVLEAKIANYLRRVQGAHGGWPLVHDGPFDMSASVKAYFALKMIGDSVDAPHMVRAREAIRSRGGAVHSNVFTRFLLAMFGVLTWRSVPVLPIEIMLLPMWSPFHLNKISYWARTTIVPLMVLAALKPRAKNPQRRRHRRTVPAGSADDRHDRRRRRIRAGAGFCCSARLDAILRVIEPLFPKKLRARAIDSARRVHRGAVERRRWPGRDLSADGQHRHDVRRARQEPRIIPPRAITRAGSTSFW